MVGSIRADSRNQITEINQIQLDRSSKTSDVSKGSPFLAAVSTVTGRNAIINAFKKMPSQTSNARDCFRAIAYESLPAKFLQTPLSNAAEPLKTVLGVIAGHVNSDSKDQAKFAKVCSTLMKANQKPSEERAVLNDVKELLAKYGVSALNDFMCKVDKVCRDAWYANHTGYEGTVPDEVIFNADLLACKQHLAVKIEKLTSADTAWATLLCEAKFFEDACVSESKTLNNHDNKDPDAQKSVDTTDSPVQERAQPDQTDGPAWPGNGYQYPAPANGQQQPVIVNVHGANATNTNTINGNSESNQAKPATNGWDVIKELVIHSAGDDKQRAFSMAVIDRILGHLNNVSNNENIVMHPRAESQSYTTGFVHQDQQPFSGVSYLQRGPVILEHEQPGQDVVDSAIVDVDPGMIEYQATEITDEAGGVSGELLAELAKPPVSDPSFASISLASEANPEASISDIEDVEDDSVDIGSPLSQDDDVHSLAESRQSMDSSVAELIQPETIGSDDGSLLQDTDFVMSGDLAAEDTLSQQGETDPESVQNSAVLIESSRPAFAEEAPAVRASAENLQAENAEGASAEIPSDNSNGIEEQSVASQDLAQQSVVSEDLASEAVAEPEMPPQPVAPLTRMQQAIAEWEKRTGGLEGNTGRASVQRSSSLNSTSSYSSLRSNTSTNSDDVKSTFQPFRGSALNYTQDRVYTTQRTVDRFSRIDPKIVHFNRVEESEPERKKQNAASVSTVSSLSMAR